jgi:hypothetical protein
MGVWLPIGEYRVTSPLLSRQLTRQLASGHVPGMLPEGSPWRPIPDVPATAAFLLDGVSARFVPTYIRGELDAARPGQARPSPPRPSATPPSADARLPSARSAPRCACRRAPRPS